MTRDVPASPPRGLVPNPPRPPLKLGRLGRRVLCAVADALVPGTLNIPERHQRILATVTHLLAYLPPTARRLFPVGLAILEWGTLFRLFSWRRFSSLPLAKRRTYLHKWSQARWGLFRQLYKGVRSVVLLAYYELPEVQTAIGYAPDAFVQQLKEKRAQLYSNKNLPVVTEPHTVAQSLQQPPPASASSQNDHHPAAAVTKTTKSLASQGSA